jgi:hypothetical protein
LIGIGYQNCGTSTEETSNAPSSSTPDQFTANPNQVQPVIHWQSMPSTGAPSARGRSAMVWTGSKMIIWGGDPLNMGSYLNTGGVYNSLNSSWSSTSMVGVPSARLDPSAVWTGSKMIVWSGAEITTNDGGLYDPSSNTWSTMSNVGAPSVRFWTASVWTGSKMIVWGGQNMSGTKFNTGGLYNPTTNSWSTMSTVGAPSARRLPTTVWTGSKMIVWGGGTSDGALYDPIANNWSAMSNVGAPSARYQPSAVWTGSKMIVWGGSGGPNSLGDGGIYDPVANTWSTITMTGAPSHRTDFTAIWTGSKMIVWDGDIDGTWAPINNGGIFNPNTNTWSGMSVAGAPSARSGYYAVWTGSRMIVWGGGNLSTPYNDGGLFTP